MAEVIIYSTLTCPYCHRARYLLDNKKVHYQEIRVDEKPEQREQMIALSGRRTVPQIFINGQSIGGCDELYALEKTGQLDQLLGLEE